MVNISIKTFITSNVTMLMDFWILHPKLVTWEYIHICKSSIFWLDYSLTFVKYLVFLNNLHMLYQPEKIAKYQGIISNTFHVSYSPRNCKKCIYVNIDNTKFKFHRDCLAKSEGRVIRSLTSCRLTDIFSH